MHRRYLAIGLMDHMGWGNMGDAAIQEAFIENIRMRLPSCTLIAFSLFPDDTRKRHNIPCYPISWCYPQLNDQEGEQRTSIGISSRLKTLVKKCRPFYITMKPLHSFACELAHLVRSFRVVRSLDLLVLSGGGQFCDLHPGLPYNVFKFCLLAKIAAVPVFIVGVGADRLRDPWNRFFAKWAVRWAGYTSLRSFESAVLIRSLGVKSEIHVCPDPAYALDIEQYATAKPENALTPADSEILLSKLGVRIEPQIHSSAVSPRGFAENLSVGSPEPSAIKVGLNPMGFCDPRRWPRKDQAIYLSYLDKVERFSLWLLSKGYSIEIFTSDIIVDVYAIEDLKSRLFKRNPSGPGNRVIVRPILTLRELLLQMSTFDYVVTSKFHGVIFSHLLAKPVIALSYLPKIEHLMRMVGHEQYCLDIEHFTVETLIAKFESAVAEGGDLSSLFRKTTLAYADALRLEFDRLTGRESLATLRLVADSVAARSSSRASVAEKLN